MTQLLMNATKCDLCHVKIKDTCIDGRTRAGKWGLLCPNCHSKHGVGLGIGKGQRYTRRPDGTFWKDGTGPIAPPVRPTSIVDRPGLIDFRKLHGQVDPVKDRDLLKRELGMTDDEISQIRPADLTPANTDDDPWFDSMPSEFDGNEFASEGH